MSEQKSESFIQRRSGASEAFLSKNLPASVDAERALLSAILLDESHLTEIADTIIPEDFYLKQHQLIYKALRSLSSDQKKLTSWCFMIF